MHNFKADDNENAYSYDLNEKTDECWLVPCGRPSKTSS